MALPAIGSLKTLRKKAGKARATITETNSTNPPLIADAFQFGQTLHQNREKTRTGQNYDTDFTRRSNVRKISDRVDYTKDQPKQTLRRSLRLVEKSRSKKNSRETFSRFFSQSGPFDTDRFSKRFDDFTAPSKGISTYFSQPVFNTRYLNGTSFFKLDPVDSHNTQSNLHVKRKADSGFKLLPLDLCPVPSKNTPDLSITPPTLLKPANININSNFESALCSQIRIEWVSDIESQLSRGIVTAFDKINRILSGDIMGDTMDTIDYARAFHVMFREEEESEFIVLDQKIYNNNYRPCVPHEKKHVVGDSEYLDPLKPHYDHNANEPSTSATVSDGAFSIPRNRWVYRTPEKKKNQQPRLDERTSLQYGVIRTSKKGDVSVYRVNKQFQDKCFVGDANNVCLNQRYFSHIGDYEMGVDRLDQQHQQQQQQMRYLKVKTSTLQDETHVVDLDHSLDLSSINAEEEYDPFLITRPSKSKSTIKRKELFEMKRPLDKMEVDDSTTKTNFMPKKRLFPTDPVYDDDYEDCIILN